MIARTFVTTLAREPSPTHPMEAASPTSGLRQYYDLHPLSHMYVGGTHGNDIYLG